MRALEAKRTADSARSGLHALLGPEAPADLEVDADPLQALEISPAPSRSTRSRPACRAPRSRRSTTSSPAATPSPTSSAASSTPTSSSSARRRTRTRSSIDNPRNAFFNDPFNTSSVGAAVSLRLPLDLGVKNARAAQLQAQAAETVLRRREALGGILFEVQRAYGELVEATQRLEVVRSGGKAAKAWVTAVSANFATGLAEAKDFSDALVAFFQFQVRAHQAVFDLNLAAAALSRATGAEIALR